MGHEGGGPCPVPSGPPRVIGVRERDSRTRRAPGRRHRPTPPSPRRESTELLRSQRRPGFSSTCPGEGHAAPRAPARAHTHTHAHHACPGPGQPPSRQPAPSPAHPLRPESRADAGRAGSHLRGPLGTQGPRAAWPAGRSSSAAGGSLSASLGEGEVSAVEAWAHPFPSPSGGVYALRGGQVLLGG